MARYTGPRLRIVRRIGTELPGLTTKTATRHPHPLGHAAASRKRAPKTSEYAIRLREKQKLRYHDGLTERGLLPSVSGERVSTTLTVALLGAIP